MNGLFDDSQLRCLHALLDTLIPPDDYPGAWDAGVGVYIQRQLQGDLAHLLPGYRGFLRGLDMEARAGHESAFADLDMDTRTALLCDIETGDLRADWDMDAGAFFLQVIDNCGEGFYSDPGNGGNRDYVAWQMVGFEVRG